MSARQRTKCSHRVLIPCRRHVSCQDRPDGGRVLHTQPRSPDDVTTKRIKNPGLLAEGFLQKTCLLRHVEIDPNDGRVLHTQPSSPDDVTTGGIKNPGQLAESRDHVACIMSHLKQQPRCELSWQLSAVLTGSRPGSLKKTSCRARGCPCIGCTCRLMQASSHGRFKIIGSHGLVCDCRTGHDLCYVTSIECVACGGDKQETAEGALRL